MSTTSTTSSPATVAARCASTATDPLSVTMPMRRPLGNGCAASVRPESNNCSDDVARSTPAWRNRPSMVASSPGPVPDQSATMGLEADTRRATLANLAGLPKLSTYMSTTWVSGSSSQCWRRSFPLMSALSPIMTTDENPIPSSSALRTSANANGPDWLDSATEPGATWATVACRRTVGALDTTPKLDGPTTRTPWPRTCATNSACSVGSKPVAVMSSTRDRAAMQASMAAATSSYATVMMVRSTSSGKTSPNVSWWMGIAAPCSTAMAAMRLPKPLSLAELTTVTAPGRNSAATLLASALASRSIIFSCASGVGSRSNERSTTPESMDVFTTYPARRNTASIERLSANVEAVNVRNPLLRAASANCSSNMVATPRPC